MKLLPSTLTSKNTGFSKSHLKTLQKKKGWLENYKAELPSRHKKASLTKAVDATLVFAQEEAGTAVCISEHGILLTCAHCVAESAQELNPNQKHWLMFASGRIVQTECLAWDDKFDLALLKIVAAEASESNTFPYINVAEAMPSLRSRLICVGHPGSEDLEAIVPGVKTNYDVLCVSAGAYRGYAEGQDIYDNSDIGALMHDCWTYWGHSGAPIVSVTSEKLVGLHSSWDDETGMRRGIGVEAIRRFISQRGLGLVSLS